MSRHYNIDYQRTHDIDWFFKFNNRCFHIASNCGVIPSIIDISDNRNLQFEIANLEEVSDAIFVIDNSEGLDLSSFEEYAKKGFISLDRVDGDFESNHYFVVAVPKKGKQPPKSIVEKIPEMDVGKLGDIVGGVEYIYDV